MTPLADLTGSFYGWAEIIAGKPTASGHFRTDSAGLGVAALTLLIAILLSVAAQSAVVGMPGLGQVLLGLLAQAMTVGILAYAMRRTLKFTGARVALNTLLVPVLYALAFLFVLSVPLTLIGPNAGLIALFGLALMIYRAAVVLAGMKQPVAIAFAIPCVIVLVAVPNALYMLLQFLPSA